MRYHVILSLHVVVISSFVRLWAKLSVALVILLCLFCGYEQPPTVILSAVYEGGRATDREPTETATSHRYAVTVCCFDETATQLVAADTSGAVMCAGPMRDNRPGYNVLQIRKMLI